MATGVHSVLNVLLKTPLYPCFSSRRKWSLQTGFRPAVRPVLFKVEMSIERHIKIASRTASRTGNSPTIDPTSVQCTHIPDKLLCTPLDSMTYWGPAGHVPVSQVPAPRCGRSFSIERDREYPGEDNLTQIPANYADVTGIIIRPRIIILIGIYISTA